MSRKLNITKKGMIAHLESLKPASRVGHSGNPQDCVVARMVRKVFKVINVDVIHCEIMYELPGDKTHTVFVYANPLWLEKYIMALDATIGTKYITAQQALTFFKK